MEYPSKAPFPRAIMECHIVVGTFPKSNYGIPNCKLVVAAAAAPVAAATAASPASRQSPICYLVQSTWQLLI